MTILLLSLLVDVPYARPETGGQVGHLTVQSTVRDILRHPLFAGFSQLILPWDDRSYDEDMPLARIGSLLPYHSQVHPDTNPGMRAKPGLEKGSPSGRPGAHPCRFAARSQPGDVSENQGLPLRGGIVPAQAKKARIAHQMRSVSCAPRFDRSWKERAA